MLSELFSLEQDFQPHPRLQATALSMILDDPSYYLMVAADAEDRPIGLFTLHTLISTAEGGRVGLVEDLFVIRSQRGRGFGRALLAEAERIVRREGLLRLQLLADRDNSPALIFYQKNGWSRTSLVALRKLP